MDKETALQLAREFLAENISLEICSTEEGPAYSLDPEDEILISFSLFEDTGMGSSKFLSISKKELSVKFIGEYEE